MSHVRDIVSGGEASTLLETEIKWRSDEEKQHMLVESGIAMDIKQWRFQKGGGTFKMSFQIVNVPLPNCPQNTCVFCCFEADDNITNLHVALDRFQDQVYLPGLHITLGVFTKIFKLLEDTCHELDLKLACSSSQIAASSSTFEEYHQEMLRMLSAKEDLTSQIQGLKVMSS
ncbi:hypothetical protein EMCRGX_G024068 [Ephydatia muelleri]